ncbi:MAG: GNAT family N-acetyltransferase [Planctomycetes bacterium]|nr:GNAT family N-acetyltransferase [Planctomycetota bacterium]
MSPIPISINIIRRADQQIVGASLRDGVRPEELTEVEHHWKPERVKIRHELIHHGIPPAHWPQSLHWNWLNKVPDLLLLEASGFIVEHQDAPQGVMLTKTASYVARLDRGKPLVYIDYLESAPWNWNIPELGQSGQFRGIGSALLYVAIMQSKQEEFHGRVGLHALPQAESFYLDVCRMTTFGPDPHKQNLLYFELSQAEAEAHLREGGMR